MRIRFDGKTVVVSGAGHGFGRCITETFAPMHEAIEACFAIHASVTPGAVDRFDRAYEAKSKSGDDSEPGDDSKAPNYRQH